MGFQTMLKCKLLLANWTHISLGTSMTSQMIKIICAIGVAFPTRLTVIPHPFLMYVSDVFVADAFANKCALAVWTRNTLIGMLCSNVFDQMAFPNEHPAAVSTHIACLLPLANTRHYCSTHC